MLAALAGMSQLTSLRYQPSLCDTLSAQPTPAAAFAGLTASSNLKVLQYTFHVVNRIYKGLPAAV